MRGKKINTEFVAQYIFNCVEQGKISQEQINSQAELEIQNIDSKIKEIENLKKLRSNLVDVVSSLALDKSKDRSGEIKILNFFKIKDFETAFSICQFVEDSKNIEFFKNLPSNENYLFLIKELLKISVLTREDQNLKKGKLFNEFVSFVKANYTKG